MDSFAYDRGFEPDEQTVVPPDREAVAAIGTDERRMHVRAYNYWASLLDGRDFPSIEDLDPGSVADFGPHSVLLDFTGGHDNPATPYIGTAIRQECGLAETVRMISDVPSRSLLSRLTDHYLQIIANRAPVGFEAEFVNQAGFEICYRGILMPFSSDGATIDFIYGVINWKGSDEEARVVVQAPAPPAAAAAAPAAPADPAPPPAPPAAPTAHLSWDDGPLQDIESNLDEDAGLADRLSAARECAEVCKQHDGRSRAALYRALALAFDFAVAARRASQDYAEILEDAGVKAQARAPMTPIVKLVFGIDYDKTRLTEFAAALSFAERSGVDFGEFLTFVETRPGGLKALVAAERLARRPGPRPETAAAIARAALRTRPAMALIDLPGTDEFALVLTRRNGDGVPEIISLIADAELLEKALRKAA